MTRGTVFSHRPARWLHGCCALACTFVLALPFVAAAAAAAAADLALSSTLCGVLKDLLPKVQTYKPEGARAQLVMAVAAKFNYDAAKLSPGQGRDRPSHVRRLP